MLEFEFEEGDLPNSSVLNLALEISIPKDTTEGVLIMPNPIVPLAQSCEFEKRETSDDDDVSACAYQFDFLCVCVCVNETEVNVCEI